MRTMDSQAGSHVIKFRDVTWSRDDELDMDSPKPDSFRRRDASSQATAYQIHRFQCSFVILLLYIWEQ